MNHNVFTATVASGTHVGYFDGEIYRRGEEVMITENELRAFRDKFISVKPEGQREAEAPAPVVPVGESAKNKKPIEVVLASDPIVEQVAKTRNRKA